MANTAIPVLILGESGTGKSASLRNFKAEEIKVINVEGKPLPFKNKFETFSSDNYVKILKEIQATDKPVIVIDDAQYLMANEFMRRATERGFDKFTEIAQNFWNLVNKVKELKKDQIVYFLAHIERDANGNEKIKTIGKLLDEKITVEGMFTIVLKTNVTDGVYTFLTQNSGHDTVKSPIGMFKTFAIDNDLKYVDDKIRNYYEIGNYKSDAEMEKADDEVAAEAPKSEEKKLRRAKRAEKKEETAEPAETAQEIGEEAPIESEAESGDINPPTNIDDTGNSEERPARRRRNLTAEKEKVIEEAQTEIAMTGINADDAEQDEEVPFEETKEPEVKAELPRRKRRDRAIDDSPIGESTVDGEPVEGPVVRRRRRRV